MKLTKIISSNLLGGFLFIVGLIWFILLSQNELNYKTYMSENALLVGLIRNRFDNLSGIDTYFKEANSYAKDDKKMSDWIKTRLDDFGLDVGTQNFTFRYPKLFDYQNFSGQNIYGILRSPGAARSQALLVTIPLSSGSEKSLIGSLATIMALAQHSRYATYWAMDIIFLFTEMEYVGFKAWLNAYYGIKDRNNYIVGDDLLVRSGSISAGFNVEIESFDFSFIEFKIEGLNGRLPNLDLYNTAVRLSMWLEIPVAMHGEKGARSKYHDSLSSRKSNVYKMFSTLWHLASGSPRGLHGLLSDFQIPSLTIANAKMRKLDNKKQYAQISNLYRVTMLMESFLRCLNSLQERMHQSFFFYFLSDIFRYVSIGVYMIPFGVMAAGGILPSLALAWCNLRDVLNDISKRKKTLESALLSEAAICLSKLICMGFGVGLLAQCVLDYSLTQSKRFNVEHSAALVYSMTVVLIGVVLLCRVSVKHRENKFLMSLIKGSIMVLLATFLGTLSVLNISLAFFLSVLLVPTSIFVYPYKNRIGRRLCSLYLLIISPPIALYLCALVHQKVFSFPTSADRDWAILLTDAFNTLRHWMLQAWVEKDLLGGWTADIITLGYSSVWSILWCFHRI